MRTMLFVLTMAFGLALSSQASAAPYCDGYNAGFNKGYCAKAVIKASCTDRRRWCPRPRDTESPYDAGFERGVKDGDEAAAKERARRATCSGISPPGWCDSSLPPVGSGENQREPWCRYVCGTATENGKTVQSCQQICI